MSNNIRVLSIGPNVDIATRSVDWDEEYNVKDFDWVFLDYFTLDQRVGDEDIATTLSNSFRAPEKEQMLQAVATGTNIVVLLPDRKLIPKGNGMRLVIDRGFPNDLELIEESGESVNSESISPDWSWYFKGSFAWNLRIKGEPHKIEYNGITYVCDYKSLAEIVSDEMLASNAIFCEVVENSSSYQMTSREDIQEMELPGKITFLPVVEGWETDELSKKILDEFTNLDTK